MSSKFNDFKTIKINKMAKGNLPVNKSLYAELGREIEKVLSSGSPINPISVELRKTTRDSIVYGIIGLPDISAPPYRFDVLARFCNDNGLLPPHYDRARNRIFIDRRHE